MGEIGGALGRLAIATALGRTTRGAAQLRETLVQLGPTFVKAGQILSVRGDLVPPRVASELSLLRSDVPAVPFSLIRKAIEQELGQPIDRLFRALDPTPLAAASIAQVHVGELMDGKLVAVKVRRPGINHVMEQDLGILVWLAAKATEIDLYRA